MEKQPVSTPLEEEASLVSQSNNSPDWLFFQTQAKRVYGIEFLSDSSTEIDVGEVNTNPVTGYRWIVGKDSGTECFIMEHPSLLNTFDQVGKEGQKPVLARPSLFNSWFAQSLEGAIQQQDESRSAKATDKDSQWALNNFLGRLLEHRPSDWHLEPAIDGYRSRIRVNGDLSDPSSLTKSFGDWLLNSIMSASGLASHPHREPADGAFSIDVIKGSPVAARLSLIPSTRGASMAVRFLYPGDAIQLHLDSIGCTSIQIERIRHAYQVPEGIWLVAGPTGSGKSTTLFALATESIMSDEKILSAEDPVERIIPGIQQVQVSTEQGLSFGMILRSFLRQAPDTLMIGEIRDPETAAIAMQAGMTGHRVLASIHARNNQGIIGRIEDLGQDSIQAATAVRMVIHQRLVSILCTDCKVLQPLPDELIVSPGHDPKWPTSHYTARGCDHCNSGYSGRSGIFSVGLLDPGSDTWKQLQSAAVRLWTNGVADLASITAYLPAAHRRHFRFANRKDFANNHLQETA